MKLAIAPINWTNDDMPDLGGDIPFEQCISEMALAGYSGCEVGNKFPGDPRELREALELRGLQVCNQWFTYTLTTEPFADVRRKFTEQLTFLQAMGAKVIGGSECGRSNFDRAIMDPEEKIRFNEKEWEQLTSGLNKLGKIAREHGIKLAYHHHMGTGTQTLEETDRLLENTDPDFVFLNYDCGHFAFAGVDPVLALEKYLERIAHVHLKDVRKDVLGEVRERGWSFLTAVMKGIFNIPGDRDGMVDFRRILQILQRIDYRDWIVVEAEQDPRLANPLVYAKRARAYLEWEWSFLNTKGRSDE
jgi:inosose dehydratase